MVCNVYLLSRQFKRSCRKTQFTTLFTTAFITLEGIITTLRIVAAADEDMGKYTLLVKNSAGETQMDSLLDVMGKPKAPKVKSK